MTVPPIARGSHKRSGRSHERKSPNISALQDFAKVVAYGGFGQASRATGLSKATLSRRVFELEASLGVRLFERGNRGLKLTEEGRALHARIEIPLAAIIEATDAASAGASRPSGRLRVSTPILFGHICMGRLACEFAALYPDIRLEVVTTDHHVDLVEADVDVVIRMNPKADELLTGRRFMTDRLLAVSTNLGPPHAERSRDVGAPVKVSAVTLIRSPVETIWNLSLEGRRIELQPIPVLRFSSVLMVRDAVYAGAGVALLPRSMVIKDLEAGRLFSWGELADYASDLWVFHTSREPINRKTAAFIELLIAHFEPSQTDAEATF